MFCLSAAGMLSIHMRSELAQGRGLGVRILALLGCHHEETARNEGDLLAPTLRALRFHRFMLGNGLVALEAFSAFSQRY